MGVGEHVDRLRVYGSVRPREEIHLVRSRITITSVEAPLKQVLLRVKRRGKAVRLLLAYDENNEELVRAASASGEGGCVGRWGQHIKRVKSDINEPFSRFYDEYPDRTSVRSKRGNGKEGLFEHLTQYIAVGFDSDAVAESKVFVKNRADGGIFFYSEEQKAKIRSCKFSGKPDVQKFSGMAAYLFELAYDLALSPSNNVSNSPGFEACGLDLD